MRSVFALAVLLPFIQLSSAQGQPRCGNPGIEFDPTPFDQSILPDAIKVSEAEGRLFETFFATGTQNYICSTNTSSWTLKEPKATFVETEGAPETIVNHFFNAAPDANGGKAIFAGVDPIRCGAVVTKIAETVPSPDGPGNINWLKTTMTTTDGAGPLTNTKIVLRVRTRNGVPPPNEECGSAQFPDGSIFESPYNAEYWFFA